MSWTRRASCITRMLGVASAVLVVAGLPARVAARSPDQPVVVLFLEGLNSDSTDDGTEFVHVWDAVQALQPDAHRAVFSYQGGSLDDAGEWVPAPYSACDTQQSMSISLDTLDQTIHDLRSQWPDAKLALVGHSLGGFLAMSWLANAAEPGVPDEALPDIVISVDSPLRGLVPEQVALGWQNSPPIGCSAPTVQFELARYRTEGWDTAVTTGLAKAVARHRLVVMVGNDTDIGYACCPGLASGQHLDVPGAIVWQFSGLQPDLPGLAPGPFASHHAALFNARVVLLMAGAIVAY